MSKENKIVSSRLILTEIKEEDAGFIVLLRSDPKVYKYFKYPKKITMNEHLKWFRERYSQDGSRIDYIACEQDSGHRVGVFGISRCDDISMAEVSYILAPDKMGKGYASEAIQAIMDFYSIEWNIETFIAEINKDNEDSIRFIEKLGFTRDDSGNAIDDCFVIYKSK